MLPGTDALGYIACTGTNFCIRCYPLSDCGWFPTFTITEDYMLGMILKAKNYKVCTRCWTEGIVGCLSGRTHSHTC
jgi:cellulose synthase/poly-beta-1,6-N-acetylglucosamine synthase-like glycosyltransferase